MELFNRWWLILPGCIALGWLGFACGSSDEENLGMIEAQSEGTCTTDTNTPVDTTTGSDPNGGDAEAAGTDNTCQPAGTQTAAASR
jgi:hypothetical protein